MTFRKISIDTVLSAAMALAIVSNGYFSVPCWSRSCAVSWFTYKVVATSTTKSASALTLPDVAVTVVQPT